jgi:hypothetical protein
MQVIDNSYADSGKACVVSINSYDSSEDVSATPIADAQASGYNGIVGLNFLAQDCGSLCVANANIGLYYTCSGTTCTSSTAALNLQMTNPVSMLQYDNNGVVLSFGAMNFTGASSATGQMFLGIGTQANNTPSASVKTLTADPNENDNNFTYFTTSFQGSTLTGFIDSGSGCLAFPFSNATLLPEDQSVFTPKSPVSLSATQIGYNNIQSTVSFTVAGWNNDMVQPECGESLGNSFASSDFDWGFPFFVGRSVYVGLEGATSTLGSGLYWAY